MLYDKFILKLLDLQEIFVTKIEETDNCLFVYCSFVGLSFSHSLVIQSFIGCLLVYRFISG